MKQDTLHDAQAKFDEICTRKRELLVESANRKIESAKLTLEASKLAGQFKQIDMASLIRCW